MRIYRHDAAQLARIPLTILREAAATRLHSRAIVACGVFVAALFSVTGTAQGVAPVGRMHSPHLVHGLNTTRSGSHGATKRQTPSSVLSLLHRGYGFLGEPYRDESDALRHREFSYSYLAEPDSFYPGIGSDGSVMVAQAGEGTVELAVLDPSGYAERTHYSAKLGGTWETHNVYFGPDGFIYVLAGRYNQDKESPTYPTILVRRYDQTLQPKGEALVLAGIDDWGIADGNPSSSPSMTMSGHTLLVHTSRTIFHVPGDSVPNHEGNLTFTVDLSSMTPSIVRQTWVSHSFAEFARVSGDDAVLLDHGDGYPNALDLHVVHDLFNPTPPPLPFLPEGLRCEDIPALASHCPLRLVSEFEVFPFGGAPRDDDFTGTTANGFEIGPNGALTTGVSIPHAHPVRGVTGNRIGLLPNVYLISTDLNTGASRFRWLTTLHPTRANALVRQPRIVPVGEDQFAILFEVTKRVFDRHRATGIEGSTHTEYRLVSSDGAVLAQHAFRRLPFGASQPVLAGRELLWVDGYPGQSGALDLKGAGDALYGIDVSDPRNPSVLHRRA